MWASDEAGGSEAGPGDEAHENHEKDGLNGSRNTKSTKLGTIVNEQIPVAEKTRRRGQYLRHVSPLQSSNATRSLRATPIHLF
jgi:hypothetical protein